MRRSYWKQLAALLLAGLMMLGLSACNLAGQESDSGWQLPELQADGVFSVFDQTVEEPAKDATVINLNGIHTEIIGEGASRVGQIITIEAGGTYRVSGILPDGQLRVQVTKAEWVRLYFDGVEISNSAGAAIWVQSADKVSITLAEGSENKLTDAEVYQLAAGETKPNACLYSEEDLTVNGSGKLTVNGRNNNGIGTKNDLRILGPELIVSAPNNALKGNDSVAILSGKLDLKADGDGIKADETNDVSKGYIQIRGGEIAIEAGDDGLQAATAVLLDGGKLKMSVGGQSINCPGRKQIAEGVLE